MSATLITSRDAKGLHAVGLFEAAYNQAGLTDPRAQRLNENGGELKKRMMALIKELSATNRYADQQVSSTWTYPPEYRGAKDLHAQLQALVGILPGLDPEPIWAWYKGAYDKFEIPDWVEGAFAVPSEFALQRIFHPEIADRTAAYCASVNLLMGKIADARKFYNYRDGQIDQSHLWRTERTLEMLDALWEMQGKSDFIVLPAQLGMRHRGRSVLRARECFIGNEFGAGSLEGLAIALTHPERYVRWEQLHTDFPGDDFSSGADGQAGKAPYLAFNDGKVWFDAFRTGLPSEYYGSVSCWLPPQ